MSYTIAEENLLFYQVYTIYIKCVTESDVLFLSNVLLDTSVTRTYLT